MSTCRSEATLRSGATKRDAARLVHACFQRHCAGDLPSGAHYFAISDNTYNIFDIETPQREVGYDPVHNAETYY